MGTVSSQTESIPEVERVIRRIRRQGQQIAQRESQYALRRLRAKRDLSEREEQMIQELADWLADSLLTVPESHLRAVRDEETEETAAIVLSLFDDE